MATLPALADGLPVPAGVAATSMTFDDEFDTFVSSPTGYVGWMTTYPYEGEASRALADSNKEAEFYSDTSVGHNPFSVHDGILSITAEEASPHSNPYRLPYTSGLITTHGSFAQTYGYFEIRTKLPAGRGLWPAFWLLPVDFKDYHSESASADREKMGGQHADLDRSRYVSRFSYLWSGLRTRHNHVLYGWESYRYGTHPAADE